MVATAKVKITNSRGDGSVDGGSKSTGILKDLLKEFRKLTGTISKSAKLGSAGLGGGGGLLGGLGAIGGGGTAAVIAAIAAIMSAPGDTAKGSIFGYEKAIVDGKETILQVNQKTGEIVDTLDKGEAIEKDILDSRGNIRKELKVTNKQFIEMTKNLENQAGAIVMTSELFNSIASEAARMELLYKKINGYLQLQADEMAQKYGTSAVSVPGSVRGALNMKTKSTLTDESFQVMRTPFTTGVEGGGMMNQSLSPFSGSSNSAFQQAINLSYQNELMQSTVYNRIFMTESERPLGQNPSDITGELK